MLLTEPGRAAGVRRLQALGAAGALHPALARPAALLRLRRTEALAARAGSPATWLCYLLGWMAGASEREAAGVGKRLGMSGPEERRLLAWPNTVARFSAGLARQAPSVLRHAVRGLATDEIVAAAAGLDAADARALLAAAPGAPGPALSIRGADLIAAGVPPGPALGRALELTLAALDDGRIGPAGQLAFALRAAAQGKP
jgi:poly(A) polymerase